MWRPSPPVGSRPQREGVGDGPAEPVVVNAFIAARSVAPRSANDASNLLHHGVTAVEPGAERAWTRPDGDPAMVDHAATRVKRTAGLQRGRISGRRRRRRRRGASSGEKKSTRTARRPPERRGPASRPRSPPSSGRAWPRKRQRCDEAAWIKRPPSAATDRNGDHQRGGSGQADRLRILSSTAN
jgi:hypothetical protein